MEYIFNTCIVKSIWPDALEISQAVVPIDKNVLKYLPTNYRPISPRISMISNIPKISDIQFGFLKNRSTKDVLFYINNLIYNKIKKVEPVTV